MARITKVLSRGWKFHRGECPDAWFKGFDDGDWPAVVLPHDWSVTEPFDRKHSSGGGYLPGGVGWYRGRFPLPEGAGRKKALLVFDGVYNHSRTWVNSYYFGKHPYGYTPYSYDISHAVALGQGELEISVRAEHEHTADSRWYTGSGITRQVKLILWEPVHLKEHGVFFSVVKADEEKAAFRVKAETVNESGEAGDFTLRHILTGPDGKTLWAQDTPLTLAAGEAACTEILGEAANAPLWSPRNPSLCLLTAQILQGETVLDEESMRVGLRTFRFDPDEGFFVNGVNTLIQGVCMHHDAGPLGAAVPVPVWRRRLTKLKAMGCNAIRMSHNPQMTELYDLTDEMGFLVMDEAFDEWEGPKNKWWQGHNVYPPKHYGYYEDFPEWHAKDLAAMVLRDRNHPSVILWSIGNEIDYPNDPYCHASFAEMTGNNDANKPAAERRYSPDKPDAARLPVIARELKAIVRAYDDTRPVTAAIAYPELSNVTGYCDVPDVCGYNYKEQWYEADHARYPRRILLGSENGHGYEQWKAVRDLPYISGQFLWTGFDFFGETRLWPDHGSHAGLLTTAGFEKPDYYFRQSLWSETPVLTLMSRRKIPEGTPPRARRNLESFRWDYNSGEEVEAVLYTNCPRVRLSINGRILGEYETSDSPEGYLAIPVAFEKGTLTAQAVQEGLSSSLVTTGAAAGLSARADKTVLTADGTDMAQVEVTLTDASGRWVPGARDAISASVTGCLEFMAMDHGDLLDPSDCASPTRHALDGRLIVYVRAKDAGNGTLTLSSPGLAACAVAFQVLPEAHED